MLLEITTTHDPATDLGYLLFKNPNKLHSFTLSFGTAHVFYPEVTPQRCTAALLLEIDPINLVRRGSKAAENFVLQQYVNDRPYVASSFMSVAIAQVFGTALSGRSKERPELAEASIPLEIRIPVLPARGGEELLRKLFEPLGYSMNVNRLSLDEKNPEWGDSRYYSVTLNAEKRLCDVLKHLYVLVPVLDDEKHYWVGSDEVGKLLRHASDWLKTHPHKEQITRRYLRYSNRLTREALARLIDDMPAEDVEEIAREHSKEESQLEEKISLNEFRGAAVIAALKSANAKRVIDLGCGSGKLLQRLLKDSAFEHITGMDVSYRDLEVAQAKLKLDRLPDKLRSKIDLFQGSLIYRDARLANYDAATVVEVIEHLELYRLAAFERVLFEFARFETVIVTTPNVEYNKNFEGLAAGKFRHKDHRFEWTRQEFQDWANKTAGANSYFVRFLGIGPDDPSCGSPTQMAVFTKKK
jgi:3' terminal RNA ribose 2'-O-methyltransferase Hen1